MVSIWFVALAARDVEFHASFYIDFKIREFFKGGVIKPATLATRAPNTIQFLHMRIVRKSCQFFQLIQADFLLQNLIMLINCKMKSEIFNYCCLHEDKFKMPIDTSGIQENAIELDLSVLNI